MVKHLIPSSDSEKGVDVSDQAPPPQPRSSATLFLFGLGLTILWLLLVALWWAGDLKQLQALSPNEFGDFLGGTFAPVAFLWLVLGFWQQGKELRNSADALWLQMEELRSSVDQQRDLVKATRDLRESELTIHEQNSLERRRAAQPMLTLSQSGGSTSRDKGGYLYRFRLGNSGRPCTAVEVVTDTRHLLSVAALNSGGSELFSLAASATKTEQHRFSVSWIDTLNNPGRRTFSVITGPDKRGIELLSDTTSS